ncbi:MAG: hypothetical protein QXE06_07035 [Candidatus Bathyarchaeia archaeon]
MQVQTQTDFLYPFDQILKRIFSVPTMVLIVGDWKTGKTDFALLIAERLLELEIVKKVASNIETKDPRITFISSLERLKQWLHMDKIRKLYILDEAGVHIPRRTPMKEKNVQAIQLLPEISKAHARLIVVAQDPDGIDSQFLNPVWCKAIFVKDSLKNARLISDQFETVIKLNDIPQTTIAFDPYAIAPFTLTEPLRMPTWVLKDEQYKILWQWAIEGKSVKTIGIHAMQLNRILRKFVANILKSSDISRLTRTE